MTTSLLLPVLTASPASTLAQSNTAERLLYVNEAPFSQILSHEIAGRQSTSAQTSKSPAPMSPAKPVSTTSAAPTTTKVVSKDAPKESSIDASEAVDAKQDEEKVRQAAASAELLVMVAGLAQSALQPKAAEFSVSADGIQIDAASGSGKKTSAVERLILSIDSGALSTSVSDDAPSAADTARSLKAATLASLSEPAAADIGKDKLTLAKADLTLSQQSRIDPASTNGPNLSATAPVAMAQIQSMQLQNAQAFGHTNEKLTPSVGSAAWDQALGQRVVWMVAGGLQSASLTLNPPDLGPLQVVLNVTNDHADATFIAAQPEVRAALEAALPKLRDMLSDAGIQLGQASVNAGTPNQNGTSSQPQHRTAMDSDQRDSSLAEQPMRPLASRVTSGGSSLVDTFA